MDKGPSETCAYVPLAVACLFIGLGTSLVSCGHDRDAEYTEVAQEQGEVESLTNTYITNDFVAMGIDSSWSMTLVDGKELKFEDRTRRLSFESELDGHLEVHPNLDSGVWEYTVSHDSVSIQLKVHSTSGQDSLPHHGNQVSIELRVQGSDSLLHYVGCGGYMGDIGLHDIWALDSLSGQEIIVEQVIKKGTIPYLEIHLEEGRIMGNGGCNQILGNIEFTQDGLRFGSIASTLALCPNEELEQAFIRALEQGDLRYGFNNRRLILSNDSTRIVLRKVD